MILVFVFYYFLFYYFFRVAGLHFVLCAETSAVCLSFVENEIDLGDSLHTFDGVVAGPQPLQLDKIYAS